MIKYTTTAKSVIGASHTCNEDRALIAFQGRRIWMGVFDGISSGGGGDIAAELSRTAMEAIIAESTDGTPIEDIARSIFLRAQEAIKKVQAENPQYTNIGTTAVVACIDRASAVLHSFSIGDSAIYICSGNNAEKLTIEDSQNGYLLASGRIKPEDAKKMPLGNALDWYMGKHLEPYELWQHIHKKKTALSSKDSVLLCSDGLYSAIKQKGLAKALKKRQEPEDSISRLVKTAQDNGSEDDITIVCATPVKQRNRKLVPLSITVAIAVFSAVLGFMTGIILSSCLKENDIEPRLMIQSTIEPNDTLNPIRYENNN